jgi:hypothetical protein
MISIHGARDIIYSGIFLHEALAFLSVEQEIDA